jgi:hypothetical protein
MVSFKVGCRKLRGPKTIYIYIYTITTWRPCGFNNFKFYEANYLTAVVENVKFSVQAGRKHEQVLFVFCLLKITNMVMILYFEVVYDNFQVMENLH